MSTLMSLISGLRRGFVMDELDAWSPETLDDPELTPRGTGGDHVIDLNTLVPPQEARAS